jgi:putative oxidoreductase
MRADADLLVVPSPFIVSVRLHDFWNQTGMAAGENETHFFKNIGMMGGLLMIAAYGPGLWAFGRRDER